MGSVVFFVYIQIAGSAACHMADEGLHRDIGPVLAPSVHNVEFLHACHAVHLKEGNGIGNITADLNLIHFQVGEAARKAVQCRGAYGVKLDLLADTFAHSEQTSESVFVADHAFTGIGKFLIGLRQKHQGDTQIRIPVRQIGVDQFSLKECSVLDEKDIVRFIDPPPAGTYAAVLLAPLSEDSGEGIEHIRDLTLTGCKITDPSVLRPCMGKPAEKVPFLSSFFVVALSGEDKSHFYICIAVLGCDLRHQIIKHIVGPGFARTSDDTDDIFLQKVDADRHIMKIAVAVPDQAGFFVQGIIQEREALLGNIDLHLERNISSADPVGKEISVGAVSAPEKILRFHVRCHAEIRRRIHLAHGLRIVDIAAFDLLRAADQVFTVGLKAVCLFFSRLLLIVIQVHDRPEGTDQGGAHSCDDSGIHKHASGAAAHFRTDDGHGTAQRHRDGHCQGRADGHQEIRFGSLPFCGRLLDLHCLCVNDFHAAGCSVIESPLIGSRLFGLDGPGIGLPHRSRGVLSGISRSGTAGPGCPCASSACPGSYVFRALCAGCACAACHKCTVCNGSTACHSCTA